ncbi:NlpC/P60 family protein [Arthrobacter sp. H35-D1]|uniref:NlpC/P60 family protein n=1 Tax=Arthrobacter sp. H35-D1 TaxID=3046202 RepID=UPI0024BAF1C6|nr:NlpC/P60 family protein [Arthrobacter sp. H35-D1]MDJ0314475.1 NlpC/P60 family protein [Arthrobacter sp. H35-D1]
MASNTALGRHRAEDTKTTSISTLTKAVSFNAGGVGRQAAVIVAATGLVLTSGIAANASTPTVERASDGATTLNLNTELASSLTAASTVKIAFPEPKIVSTPAPVAPVVEEPAVVEAQSSEVVEEVPTAVAEAPAPEAAPAAAVAAPAAPVAAPAAAPTVTTSAPAPAAKPATKSGIGATIASAALAQVGVSQDCTALARNALSAVGISHPGWPASYLSLGRTVSAAEAQPGDLVYYADGGAGAAHIAVYIGNGQAVHGGWTGFTTTVFSVNVGSGPVFIAMGH